MKNPLWFKAKRYGWGWTPVTWQGWLVLLSYVVLVVVFVLPADSYDSGQQVLVYVLLPILILTALLIYVSYRTGEKPRWRWGGK